MNVIYLRIPLLSPQPRRLHSIGTSMFNMFPDFQFYTIRGSLKKRRL